MARRAVPDLPEPRKAALAAELRLLAGQERRSALDKMIHVSRSYDAGMSLDEIAAELEVSKNTAFRWKEEGERERARLKQQGHSEP